MPAIAPSLSEDLVVGLRSESWTPGLRTEEGVNDVGMLLVGTTESGVASWTGKKYV